MRKKRLLFHMTTEDDMNEMIDDMNALTSWLSQNNYVAAYESIKSNPMTRVTFDQAIEMLNHLGKFIIISISDTYTSIYANMYIYIELIHTFICVCMGILPLCVCV